MKVRMALPIKDNTSAKPKKGDVFIGLLDGNIYNVKEIVHHMVILESIEETQQILTGLDGLKSFYRKKENAYARTRMHNLSLGYQYPPS
jgi:hypothetical protein